MSHPVKGVDHIFLLVNDLENSAENYRRLGFTLSPRGLHSKEKGTGNYTIMFPEDYFELLGVVAETEGNLHQRAKLSEQGEGLHAVACRISNAAEAKSALAELGIATGPVGAFSRPVSLPNGGEGVAAFETVSFAEKEVPQGMAFMCQHKTRDMVWRPELLDQPNGATGLASITGLSETPQKSADAFARLFADGRVEMMDDVFRVHTGRNSAELIFLTPDTAAKRFPGIDLSLTPSSAFAALRFHVRALDRVRQVLSTSGVPFSESPTGLIVAPQYANGTIIEFGTP